MFTEGCIFIFIFFKTEQPPDYYIRKRICNAFYILNILMFKKKNIKNSTSGIFFVFTLNFNVECTFRLSTFLFCNYYVQKFNIQKKLYFIYHQLIINIFLLYRAFWLFYHISERKVSRFSTMPTSPFFEFFPIQGVRYQYYQYHH